MLRRVVFLSVSPQSQSPDLSEEQLRGLLDECEQPDCWIQDLETDESL